MSIAVACSLPAWLQLALFMVTTRYASTKYERAASGYQSGGSLWCAEVACNTTAVISDLVRAAVGCGRRPSFPTRAVAHGEATFLPSDFCAEEVRRGARL